MSAESTPGDAADVAYRAILDLIISGEARGGERLREHDLAARSGVSRTPVRQALGKLAAEGLVEISRHRGAQVSTVTPEDSRDLLALRAEFESLATRLSVPRLGTHHIETLSDLARQMEAMASGSRLNATEMSELNLAFHAVLIQNCGNRFLAAALESVSRPAMVARTFWRYTPVSLQRSMNHHAEILDAVRAGDPEWAEAAMRTHILAARHAYTTETPTARRDDDG